MRSFITGIKKHIYPSYAGPDRNREQLRWVDTETNRSFFSIIDPWVTSKKFSIEFTIIGRNDNYEPHWYRNLLSIIAYNRSLFVGTKIDFRVAFVEWNPTKGRSFLSPQLVKKYEFLRAIVVSPKIHQQLCQAHDLVMMLNFSFNAAIRSSRSDFILISGGDNFLGRDTATYLINKGLKKKCLYRAERVEIKNTLHFKTPQAEEIENPPNIVRIDVCDLPPYNQPPYTNACGDFLLLDTVSLKFLRGYDENILNARLHLDTRCALSAMALGFDCKLIGHIFHIDHHLSSVNLGKNYPGKRYDYKVNIPYHNQDNWGLADRNWKKANDRLYYVS